MRWILLLLLIGHASADPYIVRIISDAPGGAGEAVQVASNEPIQWGGYSITDGETTLEVPPLVAASFWLGRGNLSAFGGPAFDANWPNLQLSNRGETLQLLRGQTVVDEVTYGGPGVMSSPGLVYTRQYAGGWVDTDLWSDFQTPRVHRIGESSLDQPTFLATEITAYSSPDSSHAVLTSAIDETTARAHVHVYNLREPLLVDALVGAASRGVDVQVLLEGAPVGLWPEDRAARDDALQRIIAAGGAGYLAGNGRYNFHHLKVLVADDRVAVQSENWVASGTPPNPTTGNRGWGMLVQSPAMADWFAAWMSADRSAWDTQQVPSDPTHKSTPRFAPHTGEYGPIVPAKTWHGSFNVTPLVSPDHTANPQTTLDFLANRDRLWVQQLDLAPSWKNGLGWSGDDPLMAGLRAATGDVRVMAAAPFDAEDLQNHAMMTRLVAAGHAAREFDRGGLVLHNKAIIADDTVLLGSMNGNHHSRAMNREVGLIVTDPDIAAWYGQLFLADWNAATPVVNPIWDDLESIPTSLPTLFAAILIAWLCRPC